MIILLITLVDYLALAIYILLIAYVVLSYFMDPYHPIRRTVNSIVDPILNPIRRLLPRTGMVDFSPMVALVAVWILEFVIKQVLISFAV